MLKLCFNKRVVSLFVKNALLTLSRETWRPATRPTITLILLVIDGVTDRVKHHWRTVVQSNTERKEKGLGYTVNDLIMA